MSRLRGLLCSLLGQDVQEMTCRKVDDGPTANDRLHDNPTDLDNIDAVWFVRSDSFESNKQRFRNRTTAGHVKQFNESGPIPTFPSIVNKK